MKTPRLPLSLFAALSAGFLFAAPLWGWEKTKTEELPPVPMSFDGDASDLKATVVVPTLDTPIENGKNAIWCASMPLLWKYVENNLQKGPLTLEGNPPAAARLNAAPDPSKDIRSEDFYVNAGLVKDGIAGRIRDDMAKKFPASALPDFSQITAPNLLIGYAYMRAGVAFKTPYQRETILWEPPLGCNGDPSKRLPVFAFGVYSAQGTSRPEPPEAMRNQPDILYFTPDDKCRGMVTDCIVNLDSDPHHDLVIVAYMDWKGSLADMIASVEEKLRNHPTDEKLRKLRKIDELYVPFLNWNVAREYSELKNLYIKSGTLDQSEVIQMRQQVRFSLGDTGAFVDSNADYLIASGFDPDAPVPHHFSFDRPFLLFMKKPGASSPYFVVWVANPELLSVDQAKLAQYKKQ